MASQSSSFVAKDGIFQATKVPGLREEIRGESFSGAFPSDYRNKRRAQKLLKLRRMTKGDRPP